MSTDTAVWHTAQPCPTADELRARIAEQQDMLEALTRQVGVAALDGLDVKPLTKRAAAARDAIEQATAAISEAERRDEERRTGMALAAAHRERAVEYSWMAERLELDAQLMEAHQAAEAALARVAGLQRPGRLARLQFMGDARWRPTMDCEPYEGRAGTRRGVEADCDLDRQLLDATTPTLKVPQRHESPYFPLGDRLSVEQRRELRDRAERLADADLAAAKRIEESLS